ncbi:hypothetical protein POM88_024532 [Heracleum sosnowskyi]|uniref:Uncharacterized protein n=1 Tax=Heracleum sosnowskyi TaxID=360622 RepID=A0AAD8I4P2_9APIA|nr:hypothetical protein POM88_024532 [Heracleum sosnowskyi]
MDYSSDDEDDVTDISDDEGDIEADRETNDEGEADAVEEEVESDGDGNNGEGSHEDSGFSWDSVANDYKLLAIPSGCSSSCTHSNGLVYSSRTNCWSSIADPPVVHGLKVPSVIVKGIPYWKCLMLTAILKFEARNNEFTCFTVSKDVGKRYNLANLNDCLARIEFSGKTDSMDVYQYNEENNGWRKMFTVNFTENLIISCPTCFKYGGEIIFNGSFYLTDSKSTQIKRLAYQIHRNSGIHGHSYTPSLVVLEGMEPLQSVQDGEIDPEVISRLEQRLHRLVTILVETPHL